MVEYGALAFYWYFREYCYFCILGGFVVLVAPILAVVEAGVIGGACCLIMGLIVSVLWSLQVLTMKILDPPVPGGTATVMAAELMDKAKSRPISLVQAITTPAYILAMMLVLPGYSIGTPSFNFDLKAALILCAIYAGAVFLWLNLPGVLKVARISKVSEAFGIPEETLRRLTKLPVAPRTRLIGCASIMLYGYAGLFFVASAFLFWSLSTPYKFYVSIFHTTGLVVVGAIMSFAGAMAVSSARGLWNMSKKSGYYAMLVCGFTFTIGVTFLAKPFSTFLPQPMLSILWFIGPILLAIFVYILNWGNLDWREGQEEKMQPPDWARRK